MNKKPLTIKNTGDLKNLKEEVKRKKVLSVRKNKYRITVHLGTCGIASGAEIIQNSVIHSIVLIAITIHLKHCCGHL